MSNFYGLVKSRGGRDTDSSAGHNLELDTPVECIAHIIGAGAHQFFARSDAARDDASLEFRRLLTFSARSTDSRSFNGSGPVGLVCPTT